MRTVSGRAGNESQRSFHNHRKGPGPSLFKAPYGLCVSFKLSEGLFPALVPSVPRPAPVCPRGLDPAEDRAARAGAGEGRPVVGGPQLEPGAAPGTPTVTIV